MMSDFFWRLRTPEAAPPWGIFVALFVLVMAFAFMTVVGSTIGVILLGAANPAAPLFSWMVGGMLLLVLVAFTLRTPEQLEALCLNEARLPVLIAFGVGLGTAVTLDLIAIPFTGAVLRPPELATFGTAAGAFAWLLAAVFMLIVQPFAEELVFRGVLYPALRAAQSVWAALIVTSLFYGIFHLIVYPPPAGDAAGLWYGLTEPLLVGLVLTVIRAGSRSTRAAVAAHVGVGVFALLKTTLIVGGM